jgi:ABC-type glycerol-3-phosphate transport system permease component
MISARARAGQKTAGLMLRYAVLIGLAAFALFPIFWAVTSAFKSEPEISRIPVKWIPNPWHWENFPEAWNARGMPFGRYFANSAILTGSVTVLQVALSTLAGYGFAKFRFPGRNLAFIFVLSTMMLPMQVIMVPLYDIISRLGWVNTRQGMIFPLVANAFSVYYMRQFMVSIPGELVDAARIDGANEFQVFLKVIVPMSRSAIAGLALLQTIAYWDAFLWPLIVAQESRLFTFALGLMALSGSDAWRAERWQMAMATVMMLPMMLLFIVAQRQIMESTALSGLKH